MLLILYHFFVGDAARGGVTTSQQGGNGAPGLPRQRGSPPQEPQSGAGGDYSIPSRGINRGPSGEQ